MNFANILGQHCSRVCTVVVVAILSVVSVHAQRTASVTSVQIQGTVGYGGNAIVTVTIQRSPDLDGDEIDCGENVTPSGTPFDFRPVFPAGVNTWTATLSTDVNASFWVGMTTTQATVTALTYAGLAIGPGLPDGGIPLQDSGMSTSVTILPVSLSAAITPTTADYGGPNPELTVTLRTVEGALIGPELLASASSPDCPNDLTFFPGWDFNNPNVTQEFQMPLLHPQSKRVCTVVVGFGSLLWTQTVTYLGLQNDPGPCIECEGVVGLPINISTGDVSISSNDYSVPGLAGGLSVTRIWNSLWNQVGPPFSVGMFGSGWTSSFEERLQNVDSSHLRYWRGSGNTWVFQSSCSGCSYSVQSPPNQHATLSFSGSTYTMTFTDGTTKTFDNSGYLTRLTDRNGNQTAVTYDTSKRITKITAPGGQSISFAYGNPTNASLATSAQDSVGTVATYSYSGNNLAQVIYADASQLNYSYDGANNITSVTDSQAKVLESHAYDNLGRGLTSSRANGIDAITVSYPSSGATALTDSFSNATTYSYATVGSSNYMTGILGPGCDTCGGRNNQTFTQDASGNRLSAQDPNGNVTSYTYDSSGNILTRTNAAGTWTYTYNSFGEVLTAKDPMGFITTNVYDGNGNLTSTTAPSPDGTSPGSKTSFTYDRKGQLSSITDPLNNTTSLTYYTTGLLNTIKDAQRNITTFAYDARGNRASVKDALSNTTTFTYDSMNRLTKITQPGTVTTQFGYDYRGRRTTVTDANNKTTTYAYDDADRLTQVTDAANNATVYEYDTENNLTGISDAANHTTGFTYDPNGRVSQVTFPSSLAEGYSYDANGNLLTKTDRDGNTVSYTYDAVNRVTQKSYPDSTSVTYTYDADSRLTQVGDPTGTYQFTYDNMGRLKQTTNRYAFLASRNIVSSYGYDAASNRTAFTDPENSATAYTYDTLNRLSKLTDFQTHAFGYTYDALSRRTQMTRANSLTTSYTYDVLSNLLSVKHVKTSTLDGASYTVDSVGNRTARTALPSNLATSYTYDAIYQLLTAKQGATTTESYSFDGVGNRLSSLGVSPYSYNSSNELTSTPSATYTYDNNGNTLTKTDSTGTTTYTWDFENRLTSVALPGSGGTVTFKYDPFGRRIYKSSSAGTSIFAYDGDNLIEEMSSAGAAVARYTQPQKIDEPLAVVRSGVTSYYEADGLGSITSLSSATGALAQTYTFDSFGKQTASQGSLANPFRYASREFDTETGLYYYRHRYYDQTTGRFLSEDLLRFDGAEPNPSLYWYVRNNPTGVIDPLGLWPKPTEPVLVPPCLFCVGFGQGVGDMWSNYERMKQRNWKGDDLYYHCMGNCQAANEGAGGPAAAAVASWFRTDFWGRLTEPDWRDDKKANCTGQLGGDCNKTCAPFVPKSSPGKPKFPGW